MPPKTFEEVWRLLHKLEGRTIETLSNRRRNLIGTFEENRMTRRTASKSGSGWEPPKFIPKKAFENLWRRLSIEKILEIRDVKGYIFIPAACFVSLPELGVEMVNTKPLTLRMTHAGTLGANPNDAGVNDDENDEDFGELERVIVDPNICSGKPTIKGTRIMVSNILGMMAGGYAFEQVLGNYPELTESDVSAALDYASQIIDEEKIIDRR